MPRGDRDVVGLCHRSQAANAGNAMGYDVGPKQID